MCAWIMDGSRRNDAGRGYGREDSGLGEKIFEFQ